MKGVNKLNYINFRISAKTTKKTQNIYMKLFEICFQFLYYLLHNKH